MERRGDNGLVMSGTAKYWSAIYCSPMFQSAIYCSAMYQTAIYGSAMSLSALVLVTALQCTATHYEILHHLVAALNTALY